MNLSSCVYCYMQSNRNLNAKIIYVQISGGGLFFSTVVVVFFEFLLLDFLYLAVAFDSSSDLTMDLDVALGFVFQMLGLVEGCKVVDFCPLVNYRLFLMNH